MFFIWDRGPIKLIHIVRVQGPDTSSCNSEHRKSSHKVFDIITCMITGLHHLRGKKHEEVVGTLSKNIVS